MSRFDPKKFGITEQNAIYQTDWPELIVQETLRLSAYVVVAYFRDMSKLRTTGELLISNGLENFRLVDYDSRVVFHPEYFRRDS